MVKAKDIMHRETVARQRERVDGTAPGVILFRLTENYILMNEISEKTWNEELNKPFLVKIQLREKFSD